jgi:hypothetical protein
VKEHFDHQRADKQRDQMRNEIDRMRKLLESNDDVIHKQVTHQLLVMQRKCSV